MKNPLNNFLPIIFLTLLSSCAPVHTIPANSTHDALSEFLRKDGRTVLTFVGYSGAGYENQSAMLESARQILSRHDPAHTLVNIGVTPDGIGAVYKLARERGFTTMGIVSSQAKEFAPSSDVEHIFYIEDESWGGLIKGSNQLSPTSERMVGHSDVMVGIGGGEVARDELVAARNAGKNVTFIPADLNHQTAIEKARKKGKPTPTDFSGAAATAF